MKKVTVLASVFVFTVFVCVLCVKVSLINAAQPPKVYGLFDANGTYLGDVLSVSSIVSQQNGHQYTTEYSTYVPSLNGIFQMQVRNSHVEVESSLTPLFIYYTTSDCSGGPYLKNDDATFTSPWIVMVNANTYTIPTNATSNTFQSVLAPQGCQQIDPITSASYKLQPVTLPFNINTITPPFSLH